ncbi:MAG: immune inhibitor A [Bacteroidales bacterium]|nr:immune inhibitor A [Bacteroidales bacterium]
MKSFLSVLVFLFLAFASYSQTTGYSRVEVYTGGQDGLNRLAAAGIAVEEGFIRPGHIYIGELSETDLLKLQTLNMDYQVLIEDVAGFYEERNKGLTTNVDDYRDSDEYEIPEDFEFGSMGGHCTFTEIITHLDNMHTKYPNLITAKEPIGQSIEGREMWMVKISDNPGMNETEPEVLYTALHHAREPAGVMTLLFYMYYLLENYDDPYIKTLVDNTQMYFIPVVNPDGYVYNQTTNPNGGGMWRKNRKNNGNGCWGVDLNRNYGYKWGNDNNGSSPDPCDETYRGTAAFSEPEIDAVRNFCENHEFRFAINYHTYSNLLLYPWGYTSTPCADDATFDAFSEIMTMDSHYTFGPGSTTIYPTNGGSDDWMYGEQTTKPLIYAFTPELGGDGDGFWCPLNRIIPIARENMIMNLSAAAFSLNYAAVEDKTPTLTGDLTNYLVFDITRLGLEEGGSFTVSLTAVSPQISGVGAPVQFSNMDLLETKTDSILYTLDGISSGTPFSLVLTVNNGDFDISDTLHKVFGEPTVIYQNNCNSISGWNPGYWDVITSVYHSPTGSITDSKNGNYQNNQTNIIQLQENIDLSSAAYAQLSFWAKWEIESGYDYVQVLVSTGSGWNPLEGKYTVTGSQYQAEGEPVFDGFQTQWVWEEMDLSEYLGETVSFRFILKSDSYVVEDGFYFDDFTVTTIDITTGEKESHTLSGAMISDPVPNPVNGMTTLRIADNVVVKNGRIIVFDVSGKLVSENKVEDGKKIITLSTGSWQPGLYFYRLEGEGFRSETKKMLVY